MALVENLIVFRARVENSDVWAILDNGAGSSLIDEGVARRLGISVSAPIGEFKTATGQLERRATSSFSFSIPGMLTATSPLPATDLSFASKMLGRPIGLIIGRDFFSKLAFLIRPSRNTFELGPSGSVNIPQGLPGVDVGGPYHEVTVEIDGKPFSLSLDLGYNGEIALTQSAWDRLALASKTRAIGSANLQGEVRTTLAGTAFLVKVGTIQTRNVAVKKLVTGARLREGGNYDGRLGMGFLAKYNFLLDLKAGRLWFVGRGRP